MIPTSERELTDAIASATGPLALIGGGTRGVSCAGEPLQLKGLSGVSLYDPGALTMVAQAGTPLSEITAMLAAENQQLAFEPSDLRRLLDTSGEPTVGGAFASLSAGPRRIQAGAARDFLLGVRFVDGLGTVVSNGGRVMKNVTGYDLVKLLAGSYGTLGALSEVSFKVLPAPECIGTLVWEGLDPARALSVFTGALGAPFDVTGAARLPEQGEQPARTLVRVEGFEKSVKYRLNELGKRFVDLPAPRVICTAQSQDQLWPQVRDVQPFQGQVGNVWRTSVKPSDMLQVMALSQFQHVVDWGGGLIWTLAPDGHDLRADLRKIAGHSTLVRASQGDLTSLGRFAPEPAPLAVLSAGLRAKFDPRGILNAGVMG